MCAMGVRKRKRVGAGEEEEEEKNDGTPSAEELLVNAVLAGGRRGRKGRKERKLERLAELRAACGEVVEEVKVEAVKPSVSKGEELVLVTPDAAPAPPDDVVAIEVTADGTVIQHAPASPQLSPAAAAIADEGVVMETPQILGEQEMMLLEELCGGQDQETALVEDEDLFDRDEKLFGQDEDLFDQAEQLFGQDQEMFDQERELFDNNGQDLFDQVQELLDYGQEWFNNDQDLVDNDPERFDQGLERFGRDEATMQVEDEQMVTPDDLPLDDGEGEGAKQEEPPATQWFGGDGCGVM